MAKFNHHKVYQEWCNDAPRRGEVSDWYDSKAAENGVSVAAIRYAIASERDKDLYDSADAKITAAQLVAKELGASRALATRKLLKLLNAKRTVRVHDRKGNEVRSYEEPDLKTQLAAAEKLLRLHGAMSDKVEVLVNKDAGSASDEELDARIRELEKKLNG